MTQTPRKDHDDDVSVTSTIDENVDSDEEFHLIKILAERQVGEITMYLVEWEGFPLSNATWEPLEHLQQDTISDWEKFKEETGRRTASGFKVRDWKEALRHDVEKKRGRHDDRNKKRVSLGLQQTEFKSLLKEYLETTEGSLEGYEELGDEEESGQSPHGDKKNQGANEVPKVVGTSDPTISKADAVTTVQSRKHESTNDLPRAAESSKRKIGDNLHPRMPIMRPPRSSGKGTKSAQETKSTQETLSNKRGGSTSTAKGSTSATTATTSTPKQPFHGPTRTMITANSRRMSSGTGDNIFVGGKVRKENPTLLDAVVNLSREPKLLKPRHQNLVQKRLRDREGVVAPVHPPGELMSLDRSEAGFIRRNSAPGPLQAANPPAEPSSGDNQPTQRGIDLDTTSGLEPKKNTKKRKLSVRWDDTVTIREATDESSLFVSPSPSALNMTDVNSDGAAATDPAPACTPNAAPSSDSFNQLATQPISRECQFGTRESRPITLTFTGLPVNSDIPWLVAFRNQGLFIFAHSCTAKDFMPQAVFLREEQLCHGHISEATDREAVESMANRLKLGGFGLICLSQGYCVLIFPSKCEEWNDENVGANTNSAGCMLHYTIFRPTDSFKSSMLAPLSYEITTTRQHIAMSPELPVLDLFLGYKYDQLLPPNVRGTHKHNFFLAFPPSSRQEACLVSQWLRLSNSECDIRTSLHPGDWSSFVKLESGTLILHEDAVWAIRMFPRFADILHASSANFNFCLFRRSLLSTPMLSSVPASTPGVGERELCRIFRPGTATLVTPSFLVSQPVQAYNFFKWFFQNFSRSSQQYRRGKLVVCAGIDDWILDLALEKSKGYEEQVQTHMNQKTAAAMKNAIEHRFKTWGLVRKLVLESTDEGESPLVFAPDVIDGNDEQSLVNWFGWWTIMNMAQLRKFSVLGSSDQAVARLSRHIQVQDYQASPVEEPEEALDDRREPYGYDEQHGGLQLVFSDEGGAIRDSLVRVETSILKEDYRPLMLYRYPVSYWDRDMPFYFGDILSVFESYERWLAFFAQWLHGRLGPDAMPKRSCVNTYAGLFYTIEGGWDRTKYPKGVKPARRPWVAIFRPVNPHRKPWRSAELFIWDYVTREKYSGDAEVCLNDLIDAQRELIKLVQEQSKKVLRFPLERVWLGGLSAEHQRGDYSHPLDITLNWLGNLSPNIRDWLPAPELHLPDRGWKLVNPAQAPTKAPDRELGDAMDVDMVDVDQPEGNVSNVSGTKKAVFHPPLMDGQKSHPRFRNNLYDWAEKERSRGGRGQSEFTFRPTMAWYELQLQHGRGFHHINVVSWESLFARYKIPDPKGL
ncbi:hypothetical protein TOPH_02623 [Tolypocladium ophioglossoides CBS 100239]|uniref:Chromo domain-containing protein n=1 Tax=Tolypocladium ophioglossoides (strain CBS 100239) TaxID=1163406 RepID=A0A0L0NG24_TOLOC|nr:hypothetical protein TOPH_02623 [Tolypocladium ophioglossoides CBS 100239]